jgi:hypothetical protein
LLARQGAEVRVGSRQAVRAESVCNVIRRQLPGAKISGIATSSADELKKALEARTLVVAAGAAGAVLLPKSSRTACPGLRVAIDLNAVPPLGIEGIEMGDKGKERDGVVGYGAIGVGETKMKIHKAAIARLFERNDQVIDAEEALALGEQF